MPGEGGSALKKMSRRSRVQSFLSLSEVLVKARSMPSSNIDAANHHHAHNTISEIILIVKVDLRLHHNIDTKSSRLSPEKRKSHPSFPSKKTSKAEQRTMKSISSLIIAALALSLRAPSVSAGSSHNALGVGNMDQLRGRESVKQNDVLGMLE